MFMFAKVIRLRLYGSQNRTAYWLISTANEPRFFKFRGVGFPDRSRLRAVQVLAERVERRKFMQPVVGM